ncbi:hypothetical protein [Acidiphilium sp.]|uniref:hypothetical protein n=1 Tax=Acidiphilium sp. TaxID=527 RepID=UPI00258FAD30|nr:hypothetical protein [Acidiphilium sp.]
MSILLAAFAAMKSSSSPPPAPSINIDDLTVVSSGGSSQTAIYTLESDGDIVSSTTSFGNVDRGDWIDPKASAPDDYEVRATIVSGSLSAGTAGSWLPLTSSRTWNVSRDFAGVSSCTLTIEIRKGSGSTLDSATVELTAEVL